MFKRICIFILLNFLIVLSISLILQIFNIGPILSRHGLDYKTLAIYCFIWGMVGAFISLSLSRQMAKWMLGIRIIDPYQATSDEKMVYDMTLKLARMAHLPDMPEVGIYQSKDPNAFATGPTKKRSLIAVSTGLIHLMSKEELEAVIGHEISHIKNGDMVTMTLLQGVINAFVMFLARAIAFAISSTSRNQDNKQSSSYTTYMITTLLLEIVFMILGSMVMAAFSRYREYRADAGSASLLGKDSMIKALEKLKTVQPIPLEKTPESIAALMIHEPKTKKSFIELFKTHPPLEKRISRLQAIHN